MSKGQFKFPVSPVFVIGNCVILKFMSSYTQTTWLYSMSKEKFKFCVSPVFSIGNCVTLKFMSFSTWTGSCGTLKSMSFYTQTTWLYSTCMSKGKFTFPVLLVFVIGDCVTLKFMSFSTWTTLLLRSLSKWKFESSVSPVFVVETFGTLLHSHTLALWIP